MRMISYLFVGVTLVFGIGVGFLGYLAFGDACQSTILYNLPHSVSIGVVAKCLYIFTIIGSFVMLIQPIFYRIEISRTFQTLFESHSLRKKMRIPPGPLQPSSARDEETKVNLGESFAIKSESSDIKLEEGDLPHLDAGAEDPDDPLLYSIDRPIRYFKYVVCRVGAVSLLVFVSFYLPSINMVLALGGSICGTFYTVIIPVVFYNRAFSDSPKNLKLDKKNKEFVSEDQNALLDKSGEQDIIAEQFSNVKESEPTDQRSGLKKLNYVMLFVGTLVGAIGFINVC